MFNEIKNRAAYFIERLFKKNNAQTKHMLGSIYFDKVKKKYNNINNLDEVEYKVFSQTGEDGILHYLFDQIKINNAKFVEIGVGDYSECNTRFIYENSFSKGLIIDVEKDLRDKVSKNIDLWRGLIEIENIEVDANNINNILDKHNLNGSLDLFSIDIDGIDYWVIEKLKSKISKVFVLEYNPVFGSNLEITVPNLKSFSRFKSHYSGSYYGASLNAMIKLMQKKGFAYVGSNKLNFNAFFINEDYSSLFKNLIDNLKNLEHYTTIKARDSRDKMGKFDFLSDKKEKLQKIKNLEIVDVSSSTNKKFKIDEIIKDL